MQPSSSGSGALTLRPRPRTPLAKGWPVAAWALALLASSARAAEPKAANDGARAGAAIQNGAAPNRDVASAPGPAAWARAYAQGHWSAAIELIEIVPEASRTPWHWLHLARAMAKRGQLVEGFAAYERLLDIAADAVDVPSMSDVERLAGAESAVLAQRIPWAEVALGQVLPAGALVFVNQQWLEPTRLRSPYPVNPGWHTFLVDSNGEVLAARRVFFEEGQNRLVPLRILPEAQSAEGGLNAAEVPGTTPPGRLPSLTPPLPRQRSLSWRPDAQPLDSGRPARLLEASYASLGVGLLGTALGTGLAVAAANTGDRSGAGAATGSFAIGIGALISGGVFWLLYRDASRAQVNVADDEFQPELIPGGAALRGTF